MSAPRIMEACERGSREGKALLKVFRKLVKRYNLRLSSDESGSGLIGAAGGLTQKDIEERRSMNLDSDGECKLKEDEDVGGCLTIPDVKYLVAKALGLKNHRYVRPILYQAFREGLLSENDMKDAGYDPENILKACDITLLAEGEITPSVDGEGRQVRITSDFLHAVHMACEEQILLRGGVSVDVDHLQDHQTILSDEYGEIALITSVELTDGALKATRILPIHPRALEILNAGSGRGVSIDAEVVLEEDGRVLVPMKLVRLNSFSVVETPACPICYVHTVEASYGRIHGHGKNMEVDSIPKEKETVQSAVTGADEPEKNVETPGAADALMAVSKFLEDLIGQAQDLLSALEPFQGEGGAQQSPPKVEEETETPEKPAEAVKAAEAEDDLRELAAKKMVQKYVEKGLVHPSIVSEHVILASLAPEAYEKIMEHEPLHIEARRLSVPKKKTPKDPDPYEEFKAEFKDYLR